MSSESSPMGTLTGAGGLRFERILPGPIERVWAYLVEPGKRARWLAAGAVEPVVGGRVELEFHNSALGPPGAPVPERYRPYEGMRFTGEVTRIEPPQLFAHTWDDTEVVIRLEALEDGQVKLVLTQDRLESGDERTGVLAGWHTHLDVLTDRLAGRAPGEAFWPRHERLEAAYREITGAP